MVLPIISLHVPTISNLIMAVNARLGINLNYASII